MCGAVGHEIMCFTVLDNVQSYIPEIGAFVCVLIYTFGLHICDTQPKLVIIYVAHVLHVVDTFCACKCFPIRNPANLPGCEGIVLGVDSVKVLSAFKNTSIEASCLIVLLNIFKVSSVIIVGYCNCRCACERFI